MLSVIQQIHPFASEAEEDIPNGAEIVFQIRGDAPFNKLAKPLLSCMKPDVLS